MGRKLGSLIAAAVMATASVSWGDAVITVIHGIDGLPSPVDVQVTTTDGTVIPLGTFDFNQQLGPFPVPAGDYDVEVLLDGTPVPPLSATITLEDDVNYSAVAHRTEAGDITLSLFENNLENLKRYDSRLTVRHLAAAPTVDVQLNRVLKWYKKYWRYFFIKQLDISNGETFSSDFRTGLLQADVLAAGTTVQVASTDVLYLSRGTSYIGYAIGTLGGDFALFIQAIEP